MRIKHTLWKVSNGWLLVPDGAVSGISANDAPNCAIFKSLKEFAEWKPIRKRNRKPKVVSNETFQQLKGLPADG